MEIRWTWHALKNKICPQNLEWKPQWKGSSVKPSHKCKAQHYCCISVNAVSPLVHSHQICWASYLVWVHWVLWESAPLHPWSCWQACTEPMHPDTDVWYYSGLAPSLLLAPTLQPVSHTTKHTEYWTWVSHVTSKQPVVHTSNYERQLHAPSSERAKLCDQRVLWKRNIFISSWRDDTVWINHQ